MNIANSDAVVRDARARLVRKRPFTLRRARVDGVTRQLRRSVMLPKSLQNSACKPRVNVLRRLLLRQHRLQFLRQAMVLSGLNLVLLKKPPVRRLCLRSVRSRHLARNNRHVRQFCRLPARNWELEHRHVLLHRNINRGNHWHLRLQTISQVTMQVRVIVRLIQRLDTRDRKSVV